MLTTGPNSLGGAYPATLMVNYGDSFSVTHTASFAVGLTVSGSTRTTLDVQALTNSVIVGASSTVSFQVKNIGSQKMYSPSFTLSVPTPLVLTANSTVSTSATVLPGGSLTYIAQISDGPKTPLQAYSGTLTVQYDDQFGVIHTQNFTVGFLVVGIVHLVVLNEHVVQNLDNLTITGTLLNDGTASALYTNVTASLNDSQGHLLGSATLYLGEIDPTAPVPFSLVVSYPPQTQVSPADLGLFMQYQDNYRQPGQTGVTTHFSLEPPSKLPQSLALASQQDNAKMLLRAMSVGMVSVGGVLAVVVIRRRNHKETI
jgi:hypothetical protein